AVDEVYRQWVGPKVGRAAIVLVLPAQAVRHALERGKGHLAVNRPQPPDGRPPSSAAGHLVPLRPKDSRQPRLGASTRSSRGSGKLPCSSPTVPLPTLAP